jgi:hypothetical protein
MNTDQDITPENLSLLAATINPTAAASEPEKAVRAAANLLKAAHDFLNPDEAEEAGIMAAAAREDDLFPTNELISIQEAFEAQLSRPDARYKTLKGFSKAIHKRSLFTIKRTSKRPFEELMKSEEPVTDADFVSAKWSSLRAVEMLYRLAKDDELRLDRVRKKKAAKGNRKKSAAEIKRPKPERVSVSARRPKRKNRN